MFWASFGDDASSSKRFEASVTRLHSSSQVVYELTVYHCTATKQLSFRSSS
jgi:hypothetical protein